MSSRIVRRALVSSFAAFIALSASIQPAHAATAFLMSCTSSTSVSGQFIYVGVYSYGGVTFSKAFTGFCPQSIQVL